MSVFNNVIFGMLCVELIFVMFMIAPLPNFLRGSIIRWIGNSKALATLQSPMMYISVVIVGCFAANVLEMQRHQGMYQELKVAPNSDLSNKLQAEVSMFRSQRNFYLSGAFMILLLVIYRIYTQLKELSRLEATSTALKKQADGAMTAYKALQTEKDELDAKLKASGKGTPQQEKGRRRRLAAMPTRRLLPTPRCLRTRSRRS